MKDAMKSLPDSLVIEDNTTPDDSDDEKPKKSKPFSFGGFKNKKLDSDGIVNFSEGITFKKPKFKNSFESTPCDLTKERDRERKKRQKEDKEELELRKRDSKAAQKAEKEREEMERKKSSEEENRNFAEEKAKKESRKRTNERFRT